MPLVSIAPNFNEVPNITERPGRSIEAESNQYHDIFSEVYRDEYTILFDALEK